MASEKTTSDETAAHLLFEKASRCFDLALDQHHIADCQREVAAQQHHSADKVDANADKLSALARTLENEAIAIQGPAESKTHGPATAPAQGSPGPALDPQHCRPLRMLRRRPQILAVELGQWAWDACGTRAGNGPPQALTQDFLGPEIRL
jgi:hypothetical protein